MFVGTWFSAYFRASESLLRVRNRNVTSRFRQETKVNFQSISTNVPALQWSESEDETDDDEVDGVDPVARLRLRLLAKAV